MDMTMTEGNIFRQLLLFSLPLLAGNFFQQCYNTVDSIVLGNFVGRSALAAVGTTTPIINTLIGLFLGLSTGIGVVISQFYGAREDKKVSQAVQTSLLLVLLLCVAFTIVGVLMVPFMLRLMATPADVLPEATLYLRIYFAGVAGLMLYNLGSGILRAVGDSRRPLYFLIFSAAVNTVLDLLFVAVFHWGIAGAAIATTLANLTSALLILRQLTRTQDAYRLIPRQIRIHKATLLHILGIGVPAAIESAMYAASSLLIQVPINTLGTEAVAAWSATSKVDGVYFALMVSFGVAIMAFVGQNYGAGKYQRMKQGVRVALTISLSITVALSILLMLFAPYCFRIFTDEPLVIQYAIEIMGYFVPFYFLWTCIEILANSLRGSGDALVPMVISVGGICGLRILWVFLVVPHWNTLMGISICYPVSWAVTVAVLILYFCRGKWRRL